MCSDAPDTSGINEQARKSAELGQKAFDWYTQQYEATKGEREADTKRASDIADAQIKGMTYAVDQAKDADAYSKTTFRPLEQKMVADAQAYDTPERRQAEQEAAVSDVNREAAAQRQASELELSRAGVAPDSMKTAALREAGAVGVAKAAAGAAAGARKNVEQQGYARMADAVSLGRNLPSQQATQQQIATQAGSAGVQANAGVANSRAAGTSLMDSAFGTGLKGAGQAGSLFGNAAQVDSASRGQDFSLMSSAMGMFNFKSDKNIKRKTGKPIDQDEALAEINAIPVEEDWEYDPAKGGPDDGGTPHDGPMAQTVRAKMGDAVAPGGKQIDMISMNGRLMAGMQALSKRMAKVEKQVHA